MRFRLLFRIIVLSCIGFNSYAQSPDDAALMYDFSLDKAWYMKEMSKFLDTSFLNRFEEDVRLYEKQDSAEGLKQGQILFVGSSSIRKWYTLKKDMYPLSVMNRGFGGSTFPELLYYYDRLVLKYKPSKIVLYEGDNDITASFLTPDNVIKCFKLFVQLTESYLPGTPIYFVSVKLSPAREKYIDKLLITNMMIEEYCRIRPNLYYIDITQKMVDDYGNIRLDLFQSDKLHLNEKGYQLWTDIIKAAILNH